MQTNLKNFKRLKLNKGSTSKKTVDKVHKRQQIQFRHSSTENTRHRVSPSLSSWAPEKVLLKHQQKAH